MTTFAAALLPRFFSGTRELERVPPACCVRSANVSPHQPKPTNPAGRETHPGHTLLGNYFKGLLFWVFNFWVAILFILSQKWPRLVGWLLPSQAHDCSNNLLCKQLPERSQWWGSHLTKSSWFARCGLLEIWQPHWMESLWKKFTFYWELVIHGHTGNEIFVQQTESPVPWWCLKLCRQSLQLWKFTWWSGAGEPAGNKAAVVPWQIQFPNGCLTWSFINFVERISDRWIVQSLECKTLIRRQEISTSVVGNLSQLPRPTEVVLEPKEPGQGIDGKQWALMMFRDGWGDPKAMAFSLLFPVFERLYNDPGIIHQIFKMSNFISVRLRRTELTETGGLAGMKSY